MKTDKNNEAQEQLLRDIFAEDFELPADQARNALVREFRTAWWRRKIGQTVLAAAAVLTIVFASSYFGRSTPKPNVIVSSPPAPVSPAASASLKVETISDEELLSLFPPGSCFLAELDGKQVLVFKDPELSKEFLESF